MKRLAKILIGLVVLVVLLIAGAFMWIDRAAKLGVETGATYALGVRTTLDGMNVGVISGKVDMEELQVGNPAGFTSPYFLQLGSGRVAVSLGSLMGEQVVLPELTLSGIDMHLERKGGKANYRVIVDNLKQFESQDSRPPEAQKQGKRFVIKTVGIHDIRVQVDLLPIGGDLTRIPLTIEKIELHDVGSESDQGILLAELTNIVLKAILTAVVEKAGHVLPGDITGELSAGLAQLRDLEGTTMQVLGPVSTDALEAAKRFKDIGQEIGESGKKVGEGFKDAGKELGKGLGGLLDKDKKDDDQE